MTEGFFDALRVEPQHGRLLNADDYRLKRNVAVLADGVWKRRFGANPAIVGQSIRLDDAMFEIVGVLPPGYEPKILGGRGRLDVWTAKTVVEDYEKQSRTGGYWHVVGRVKAGSTVGRAQAELDAISAQLAKEQPRTNANVRAQAISMRAHLAGGAERPLALLGLGSLFILLLALGSVVNLQLGLLTARLQEFAVRTALGAHRPRLVRQVFVESATIAAIAVALGIALAAALLAAIRAVSPEALEIAGGARLNLPVLAFAAGLGLIAATLAAVLPVMTILRSEATSGVRGALSVRGQAPVLYGRSALVVVQIALAVVLLVSAGLIGRSFVRLLGVDAGLQTRNLLAVQVFAYDRNETAAKRIAFFANTIDRIRALPGVESVGAASTVPFLNADIDIGSPLLIQGRAVAPDGRAARVPDGGDAGLLHDRGHRAPARPPLHRRTTAPIPAASRSSTRWRGARTGPAAIRSARRSRSPTTAARRRSRSSASSPTCATAASTAPRGPRSSCRTRSRRRRR